MARTALLFVLAAILACGESRSTDAPLEVRQDAERGVAFVEPEELHDYIEAGNDDVVFVDNRNAFSYEQQRISGSRLIPTDRMARSLGSLPLNKWIVLYCT